MKRFLLLFLVSAIYGCGTTSGRVGDLPVIVSKENASKVTVVRISSMLGVANGYTVALDGKDVFGIGSGQYTELLVPEGERFIAVKCFGGWSPTWKENSLKFEAKPSDQNFFVVSPSGSCAEIRLSTGADAKKHIDGAKRIELEKSSGR
jgi:hypothetical protein